MLLNCKEDCPKEFFVFVDFGNVVTKHNLEVTKSFVSGVFSQLSITPDFADKYEKGQVDYLPFIPNSNSDVITPSMFYNSATAEYRTEYNAELYRKFHCPIYPSRLSAIYAFATEQDCMAAIRKYHWDGNTIRKFKLQPHLLNRVVKVNMEIVSLDRYANRVSMMDAGTINAVWQHYWNGKGNLDVELPTVRGREVFHSGEIWEYLIEGVLTLT